MSGVDELAAIAGDPDDQAIAWFARLRAGSLPAADELRLAEWLDEPQNAAALDRVQSQWRTMEGLRGHPRILEVCEQATTAGRRRFQRRGAVAAGMALVLGLAIFLGQRSHHPETRLASFTAAPGQRLSVLLEDGSVVLLDSRATIHVSGPGRQRRIELLHGRAYFQVKPDGAHPLVVVSDGKTLTGEDTDFTVDARADDLKVVSLRGCVRIAGRTPDGTPQVMEMWPGHSLVVSAADRWSVQGSAGAEAAAWTGGRLIYGDSPISDVAAELNRYAGRRIRLAPDGVGHVRVGAVLNAGDTETFIHALEAAHLASATENPDGSVTLHK